MINNRSVRHSTVNSSTLREWTSSSQLQHDAREDEVNARHWQARAQGDKGDNTRTGNRRVKLDELTLSTGMCCAILSNAHRTNCLRYS
jgi:hypothetical protein